MTIARKFGVEIEYVGVRRSVIVDALKRIKVKCVAENYNHRTKRHWKIVRDASLNYMRGSDFTGELVSPPLYGKRGLNKLRKVVQAMADAGATVNSSCGLHVHVDANDLTPNQILAVSQRYGIFEKRFNKIMDPSRANTDWARKVDKKYHADLISSFKYYKNMGYSFKSATGSISRYRKVNIASFNRHGTIEFRQHEGTLDPDRILNWVQFCTHFVEESYNNIPPNNNLELASKLNRSLFHEIPEDVTEYYENILKAKATKKKVCVRS